MRSPRPQSNPLQPITGTVGCAAPLILVLLALSLLVPQATWGNGPVCATVAPADMSVWPGGTVSMALYNVAPTAHAAVASASICADHPTATLRAAGLLATWPYLILWLVFLWRLRALLKSAARPGGLYSPATASRLRSLGWLLASGGLAASIIESAANILIFTRVTHFPGAGAWAWWQPAQINFSFTTLIAGLTLITVARVMVLGVKMREELDVTV